MADSPPQTWKSIQKNIISIRKRNDHSSKLRQTHESILTMSPFGENKDVKEFKEQLRSIKKSIESHQNTKKVDPEMKILLGQLNTKVSVIQKWINNYAIGEAVEMSSYKDGLKKVDNHVLDNVPLLYHIVEEVRQIKKEEREMQKELLKIEKEILDNRKDFEKVTKEVKKTKTKKPKIEKIESVTKKTKAKSNKKTIQKIKKTVKNKDNKEAKPFVVKQMGNQVPIKDTIKDKEIKEKPNKKKDLKKFINVLKNM